VASVEDSMNTQNANAISICSEFEIHLSLEEKAIIDQAKSILVDKFKNHNDFVFNSPDLVADYLKLKISPLDFEVFGVLLLDNQNRLLEDVILQKGSIDSASLYPREVVKVALQYKSSRVAFYHNHPSQNSTPSQADRRITSKLQDALNTVDITVIDHFVIGLEEYTSFVKQGWMN